MEYNINHSECKVFIVQGGKDPSDGKEFPWITKVNAMRKNIPTVKHYISFAVGTETYPASSPTKRPWLTQAPKNRP